MAMSANLINCKYIGLNILCTARWSTVIIPKFFIPEVTLVTPVTSPGEMAPRIPHPNQPGKYSSPQVQ